MKKVLFLTAALAATMGMGLASCSNNDEIENSGKGSVTPMEFGIGYQVSMENAKSTRGSETTLANLEVDGNTFMVWGYYASDASAENRGNLYVGTDATTGTIIQYDGTAAAWDYKTASDKKMWPTADQKLNFQAVNPYDAGTIINTPADNVAKVGMTVTVPTAVASQKDVIFGHAEGMTYATAATVVPLTFQHALSQIIFTGKVNAAGITATIKDVKVCNAKSTADIGYLGALYVDDAGTPADPSDDVTTDRRLLAVSTGASSTTDYSALEKYAIGMYGAADVVLTSTDATALCAADGALMMIPQTGATPWGTAPGAPETIAAADIAGETYLDITCKIKNGDTWVLGSASAYEHVYIPFTINWAIGTKYTYVLNFGSGSGGYDADGNPMMNYISYSIASVESWTDGGSTEYKF